MDPTTLAQLKAKATEEILQTTRNVPEILVPDLYILNKNMPEEHKWTVEKLKDRFYTRAANQVELLVTLGILSQSEGDALMNQVQGILGV